MIAAFVALSLMIPADPPKEKEKELPEAARKELKKLEGRWKFVKGASSKGEGDVGVKERDSFMEFKGNQMFLGLGDETKETFRIAAIDPSTDPKCIDLLEKREGKPDRTLEGVFKIDGDKLLIALRISNEGKQRPVSFDKPTDPKAVVWTLQREKK